MIEPVNPKRHFCSCYKLLSKFHLELISQETIHPTKIISNFTGEEHFVKTIEPSWMHPTFVDFWVLSCSFQLSMTLMLHRRKNLLKVDVSVCILTRAPQPKPEVHKDQAFWNNIFIYKKSSVAIPVRVQFPQDA